MPNNSLRKPKQTPMDDDDEDVIVMMDSPYQTYEQSITVKHYHFYLSSAIGSPDKYTDMIFKINNAAEHDQVSIHLNTVGGQISTGVQIINAMKNSKATITTILESEAYSLGTLIFLSGDEMVLNENCRMMFHTFAGGFGGKGSDMISEMASTVDWFIQLGREIYIPFLSEEEFTALLRGEDLWMTTPEIKSRLIKMSEINESKQKEQEHALLIEEAQSQIKAANMIIELVKKEQDDLAGATKIKNKPTKKEAVTAPPSKKTPKPTRKRTA